MMRLLAFLSLAMLDLLWFEFVRDLYDFSGQPWFFQVDTFIAAGRVSFWLIALLFHQARR